MRISRSALSGLAIAAVVAAAPVPLALASDHGGHGGPDDAPSMSPSASSAPSDDDEGQESEDDHGSAAAELQDGAMPTTAREHTRPRHVDARRTAFDRVQVTWRFAGDDASSFVVRLRSTSGDEQVRVDGDERVAVLTGLAAGTRWSAQVQAVAADGTTTGSADGDVVRTPTAATAARATARAAEEARDRAEYLADRAESAHRRARGADGAEAATSARTAERADKAAKRAAKAAKVAKREAARAARQHERSERHEERTHA